LKLFDSHCHLQLRHFNEDRDEAVERARAVGVRRILNLGTRLEDSRVVVEMAAAVPECLAAVGVHPSDLDAWSPETEAGLMELAAQPGVVAWGEIGLDYYWKHFDHDFQKRVFRRQLAIARELGLPVSIHCRDAYDDMVQCLREERGAEIGGVSHCFLGGLDHARALIDMGFHLGVGGSTTYKGNQAIRDVLAGVGTERLVLETDSPYLSPVPHRGKRNEPSFVADTARFNAELHGMDAEEFAALCFANTERAFRLDGTPS